MIYDATCSILNISQCGICFKCKYKTHSTQHGTLIGARGFMEGRDACGPRGITQVSASTMRAHFGCIFKANVAYATALV